MTNGRSRNGRALPTKVPGHVAIIMDGNGRWARARGLPRLAGHRAGTDNIRTILEACVEVGVHTLTIYAFSTENWHRPRSEVYGLFALMEEVIRRETAELHRNGVRVNHVGWTEGLPPELVRSMRDAVALTAQNTRITLNVAFNYGGRAEILDAFRRAVAAGADPASLDEETFSRYLLTGGQPDPDLIIRTAGEMRLSNFLIWQAAYAEYYPTPTCWPDFGREELLAAFEAYAQRQRKFGRVVPA
ncbi:MAG TPA: polyprenyl diphosphate synthase [Chloroflexota bacterium]|jgi:undecaprenyl diphosphate synthase|nr:polyprenyl diphosphate synthase [Chloroflexota bacterium]